MISPQYQQRNARAHEQSKPEPPQCPRSACANGCPLQGRFDYLDFAHKPLPLVKAAAPRPFWRVLNHLTAEAPKRSGKARKSGQEYRNLPILFGSWLACFVRVTAGQNIRPSLPAFLPQWRNRNKRSGWSPASFTRLAALKYLDDFPWHQTSATSWGRKLERTIRT